MSGDVLLATWAQPARSRSIAADLLTGLPPALVLAAAGWRWSGAITAIILLVVGALFVGIVAYRRARRFDSRWLVRALDGARADMEDSAGLLFAGAGLGPLQTLQRARLESRLADASPLDLCPPFPARRIAALWGVGLVAIAAILLWPAGSAREAKLAPSSEGLPARPGIPRLDGQRLRVVPPAYTGLPPRDEASLDTRAPEGSRLIWTLHFAPDPAGVHLAFHDGSRIALTRDGANWTAARMLDQSLLYRVSPQGAERQPAPPLHRLDAIRDMPPQIKVTRPDRGLSLVAPGQRRWALGFEASDDYGVAPTAQLRLTLAQGEGENISFKEHMMSVRASGPPRLRRFDIALDLAAAGFAVGDDLVAQLIVSDNRSPAPHVVRGPSLILRWPADLGKETGGLEAVVNKTLPAYFRSQRQIIIDAEALIKAKRGLPPDRFLARSDGIGADQRILRLRYGQFLGEEAEGGPKPRPTADGNMPVAPDDDHGNGAPKPAPVFGNGDDVFADYGHVHDQPEAATLLDPETRATLKQALDQMWQSELNLRQGQPDKALPFAYQALGFIKKVQQATRIFLARVGPELPPIDEARRMTGKRDGLASRDLALAPRDGDDVAPATLWRGLGGAGVAQRIDPAQLDAFERWLNAHPGTAADPLAFVGAIDAVRRQPGCIACRVHLRGLIWAVLTRPPVAVPRNPAQSDAGKRYLDALRGGG